MVKQSLFVVLLLLSACNTYTCPPRTPFTGMTYGDVIEDDGQMHIIYDSCAEKSGKINWDIVDNSFATGAKQPANTINLTNNVH